MARRVQLREVLRMEKRGEVGGPYHPEKYPANTRCAKCDLVYEDGAWKRPQERKKQKRYHWKLCPACTQIRDGQTGGIVQCSGAFAGAHREELVNRIRNVEKLTKEERPLERIISMKEEKDNITVSATTEHLAARIGKSIQRDFGGNLTLRYSPEDKFAYAHWHRD